MDHEILNKFNIWNFIPIVISLLVLFLVFYKDFLEGARLHTTVNYIVSVRIPGDNKQKLLKEMLLDDLLSASTSEEANSILKQFPGILPSIESKNRAKLMGELIELTRQNVINYNPPNSLVEKYFNKKLFATSFYIPLIIYNSGRKYAHVSSLVMIAKSKDNVELKWAYTPFVELNPKSILKRNIKQKDLDRISNIFTGFTVGPSESVRVDPYFVPMHDSDNNIISRNNIAIGHYYITITGYDAEGKECFRTKTVEYELSNKRLIESFHGAESAVFLNIEKNVSSALKE